MSRVRVRCQAAVAAIAMGMGANALWAAGGPDVKVQLQGSYQSPDKTPAKWASLQDGTKVSPGDRILYSVEIANQGDTAARNPAAFGPIPAGTSYVAGTATQASNLKVEYSIDGGKTYSATPMVPATGKDGKPQMVPAPVQRYTTVRWTWSSVLPPGAKATVSYQVEVR